MTERSALLAEALRYAAVGWPVFLLGRTKRPVANCRRCNTDQHDPADCGCLTCHGFYAATTDPARIKAMLAGVPGGLLAIRTGAVSGLAVVDIDPRNGGTLDRELMTPTATVVTGGAGWHLYYRYPGPLAGKLNGRLGVDVKADNGYVVAPPSTHPATKRRYKWAATARPVAEMPPALREACQPATPRGLTRPAASPTPTTAAGGISYPGRLLAAHLDAVARAPEGRRRTTLYGAARGIARMVAAGAIDHTDAIAALTDAGQRADQTPREIRAAITGGFTDEGIAA